MIASIAFFIDSFANIVTITFSALIVIELLNVYSSLSSYTIMNGIAILGTLFIYFLSIALLHQYFDVGYITFDFFWKIVLISIAAWAPLHLGKLIYD